MRWAFWETTLAVCYGLHQTEQETSTGSGYNRRVRWTLFFLLLTPLAGCDSPAETRPEVVAGSVARPVDEPVAKFRVVMLGDSLTAGFGLSKGEAFPALVEAELGRRGWSVAVVNAGVSGDTTAGGRARLGWLLAQRPHVVVVALGANDGLRGLPVEEVSSNLREIVRASREAGARVLLAGMRIPPNYGADYADSFSAVYPFLAGQFDIAYMPFLLEGVGGRAELNLPDGIHPNAEGQQIVAATLVPYLEDLLMQAMNEEAA